MDTEFMTAEERVIEVLKQSKNINNEQLLLTEFDFDVYMIKKFKEHNLQYLHEVSLVSHVDLFRKNKPESAVMVGRQSYLMSLCRIAGLEGPKYIVTPTKTKKKETPISNSYDVIENILLSMLENLDKTGYGVLEKLVGEKLCDALMDTHNDLKATAPNYDGSFEMHLELRKSMQQFHATLREAINMFEPLKLVKK